MVQRFLVPKFMDKNFNGCLRNTLAACFAFASEFGTFMVQLRFPASAAKSQADLQKDVSSWGSSSGCAGVWRWEIIPRCSDAGPCADSARIVALNLWIIPMPLALFLEKLGSLFEVEVQHISGRDNEYVDALRRSRWSNSGDPCRFSLSKIASSCSYPICGCSRADLSYCLQILGFLGNSQLDIMFPNVVLYFHCWRITLVCGGCFGVTI